MDDMSPSKKKPELARTFEGEDIPDEQPLLLTGGVMRDYQVREGSFFSNLI